MIHDLYPFQGRYLHIDGQRCHYLDEGSGAPVVMLHGNPTWSFYYRNLVLALKGECRAIVPDHVGCGLSDKPDDAHYEYTLARRVRDLEMLLESLKVTSNITLVVHDWGGMIGMAYAVRHPEKIARMVVLNTAAFHLPKGKRLPWSLRLCRNRLLGPLLVRGLNAFCRGAARTCCRRRPLPPEVKAAYRSPYNSWRNRIAVLRFVQDIPLGPGDECYALVSEVQEKLETLRKIPLLICWGERDFVFDHFFLEEWRRRFPEAEVHAFADCGHYVLEDAGEEISERIRSFLAAHALSKIIS